jgi:hypothetical protein
MVAKGFCYREEREREIERMTSSLSGCYLCRDCAGGVSGGGGQLCSLLLRVAALAQHG